MEICSIDTLAISKKLQKGGIDAKLSDIHAEVHADTMSNFIKVIKTDWATKADLQLLRTEMYAEIQKLRLELQLEMKNMEQRLMKKLGGLIICGFTITSSLMTLMLKTTL